MDYAHGRIRSVRGTRAGGPPSVALQVCPPGNVDDYGSVWLPNTFDESLRKRLPVLCWSHDWSNPLGPGLSARSSTQGPVITFGFSDFEAVPEAKRAHAQVQDGTITDCSVGFSNAERRDPTASEIKKYPGIREVILRAQLDEVSLVLRGAVPGAKVLAVRASSRGAPPQSRIADLLHRRASGQITIEQAMREVERDPTLRRGLFIAGILAKR